MLKLLKIAITGSPASGKSSVCHFLKEFGAFVVSADEIVHKLLSQDQEIQSELTALLGKGIITDGLPDRKKIAKKIFNQTQLLQQTEGLIHPKVRQTVNQAYHTANNKKHRPPLFAAEIPLLFETGMENYFDMTIAIVSEPKLCAERYQGEDYLIRAKRFLSDITRRKMADRVIENNGSLKELQLATMNFFHTICH